MATGLSSITGLLSLIGSLRLACAASGLSYNGLAQTPQMGWVSPKALIPTLRLPKSRSAAFQVMPVHLKQWFSGRLCLTKYSIM